MTQLGQIGPDHTPAVELIALRDSFARHLRAANLSRLTVKSYLDGIDQFSRYLVRQGDCPAVRDLARAHVEGFVADQLSRWRPATAANRFRSLRQFFNSVAGLAGQ